MVRLLLCACRVLCCVCRVLCCVSCALCCFHCFATTLLKYIGDLYYHTIQYTPLHTRYTTTTHIAHPITRACGAAAGGITELLVTPALGKGNIGYIMCSYGVGKAISSVAVGKVRVCVGLPFRPNRPQHQLLRLILCLFIFAHSNLPTPPLSLCCFRCRVRSCRM